jgi:Cytochrome c7 and related cytochrome c
MHRAAPLAALALAVVLAACAGAPPSPPPEPLPPPAPTAVAVVETAAPLPTAAPTATAAAPPEAGPGDNVRLQPSQLVAAVKKLGIDFKQPLDRIPLAQKKKLMPLLQKSLGYASCDGCHVEGDFRQQTRNMKVARGMWEHFVVGMRDDKGDPIFCDTCHAGKDHILDRSDKASVKRFMDSDYEDKLTRADQKKNGCQTCHGERLEEEIVVKLWGIPAKK